MDRTYCVLRLWNKDSAVLKAENQRNVDIFEQVRRFFCLQEDPQKLLETKASIQLCRRVYLEMAEKFAWPDIERTDPTDSVFCYGLRDQFGVLVDGTVVPCCLDSDGNIPLGNVYQQPLAEILTSPRAQGAPRWILLPPSHRGALPPVRLCTALFHPLTFCFNKHHPLLQAL